jgi:hypothetical protein
MGKLTHWLSNRYFWAAIEAVPEDFPMVEAEDWFGMWCAGGEL